MCDAVLPGVSPWIKSAQGLLCAIDISPRFLGVGKKGGWKEVIWTKLYSFERAGHGCWGAADTPSLYDSLQEHGPSTLFHSQLHGNGAIIQTTQRTRIHSRTTEKHL